MSQLYVHANIDEVATFITLVWTLLLSIKTTQGDKIQAFQVLTKYNLIYSTFIALYLHKAQKDKIRVQKIIVYT